MSFAGLLVAELTKLRRSLVSLLLFGIPLVVLVLVTAIVATGNGPPDWERLAMSGSAIWAYFLFPMTATAFTALQAQLEHEPRAWSHALTGRAGIPTVILAKALVALAFLAVISILVGAAVLMGGAVASPWSPDGPLTGPLPLGLLTELLSRMFLAGFLLVAIQFAIAMASPSFAAAVVVGISGTFVAVVATSAKAGVYFPWLLPTNILASDPERALRALMTGFIGGIVLFGLTCWWLGRRDWN